MIIAAVKAIADATEIPIFAPTVSESGSVSVVTENKMYFICYSNPICNIWSNLPIMKR